MVLRTLALALAYFALVFGAGFMLGPLRVLFVEPRIGERAAQLAEMPLMLVVIVLAARWLVRRFGRDATSGQRLAMGVAAALLVLAADTGVGILLRGLTAAQVLVERDPVAGTAFYALLVVCALAPWACGRRLGAGVAVGGR